MIFSRNRMYIGTNNDADHIPTVCDVTKFPKSLWRVSVPVQLILLTTLTNPLENNFFSLMNRDNRAQLACFMNSWLRSQGVWAFCCNRSSNCRWVLTVPAGRVQVEIIYSDIETSANCAFDSLEIYDGRFTIYHTIIASRYIPVHESLGFLNIRWKVFEILWNPLFCRRVCTNHKVDTSRLKRFLMKIVYLQNSDLSIAITIKEY